MLWVGLGGAYLLSTLSKFCAAMEPQASPSKMQSQTILLVSLFLGKFHSWEGGSMTSAQ
jgi:hypothetical protein